VNEGVRTEFEDELALVTIDRPERRNALDSVTAKALAQAINEASQRVRLIILTGAGGAFCAGGDLDELERWSDLEPGEISGTLYESFQAVIRSIRSSPAVVIAAIGGAAVGAGMDVALACDLRIAAQGSKLGQVWVRLGVIPGTGGAWLTQALAGPTNAAELLLTGKLVDAAQALTMGLVNRVCPEESLMGEARNLAAEILALPPDGVRANKKAYVMATEAALEAALRHAAEVQPERFTSDEFRRAVRVAKAARS
jgi:enoyl-CoA hydratase/carnithine racemase